VHVAGATVTVEKGAVARLEEKVCEDEEETAHGSVWEVGRVRRVCGCLDNRTSMEENGLHRTNVVVLAG
jgi:hypothetical protein